MTVQINQHFHNYMAEPVSESCSGLSIFRWELSSAIETRSMAAAFSAGFAKAKEIVGNIQSEAVPK